jgi:hypothetical protein
LAEFQQIMKSGRPKRPAPPRYPLDKPPLSEAARSLLVQSDTSQRSQSPRSRAPPGQDVPDPYEGLLTQRQVAELFDVTPRTIRNWQKDGLLEPVMRPKGRVFYRLTDLLRLFETG